MTSNAETYVVKLNYGEQLRRFPIAKGISFADLRAQVVQLLEIQKDADIVLKYSDEEGDLITISSDLELASALVPEKILRLTVIEKKSAASAVVGAGGYPPVLGHYPILPPVLPDVMDVTPTAPTSAQGGAFPPPPHAPPPGFEGEDPRFGMWGRGGHHRGGRGGWGRGGFPGPHRGGHPHHHHHRGGPHAMGPYGMPPHHPHHHHPRADMTPEELHEFKKERKHMCKEMKREWKEHNKCMRKEWKQGKRDRHCVDGPNSLSAANDRLIARFAKDVTIPDGTHLGPGTTFVKTWRIRNEGATEWPAQGCVLRFLGKKSDSLGCPETVPVPGPVAPNAEVEVSVNLVAPEKPGRYTGYWKMCAPDGRKFGQRVWVSVVVPGLSSSSSSDSDQEADKYEALVDSVLATGLCVKRHRVFRMLQKTNGDVNAVCERLAKKEEKKARKAMKKQMKL